MKLNSQTMNIHQAFPTTSRLKLAALAAIIGLALAGCNFSRNNQIVQPTAGSVVQPTQAVVQPEPTTAAPAATAEPPTETPAATATSETAALESEIDQSLQDLDNMNSTADQFDDVP